MPTAISWTDDTWNPVTGCTRVSRGCARCYIERQTPMRIAGRRFARIGNTSTTGVQLHPERLARVPKGPRIFTCSMSDLFHEDVPDSFIARVFLTMRDHETRTFQVLTKRPERALAWCRHHAFSETFAPLYPNVWVGVSIESARYSWRADVLREIPAQVRFISAEPLVGSLFEAATPAKRRLLREASDEVMRSFIEDGMRPDDASSYLRRVEARLPNRSKRPLDLRGIDWLIAGGESGPGFQPLELEHARELRDACVDAGVAFFFKQVGGRTPASGGKLLDGREWCEFPRAVVPA
jgi:protein gp37